MYRYTFYRYGFQQTTWFNLKKTCLTNLARHDSMTRKEFTLTCHHHENNLTMEGFQEGESRWFDHRRRGGWWFWYLVMFFLEGKKIVKKADLWGFTGAQDSAYLFHHKLSAKKLFTLPHPFSHHFTFPPFSFSIYAMTKFSPSRIHCFVSYCLCNSICRILCRLVHVPLYLSTLFIFHLPYSFPHHITFFIASPFISLPHSFVFIIHFCLPHSFYV